MASFLLRPIEKRACAGEAVIIVRTGARSASAITVGAGLCRNFKEETPCGAVLMAGLARRPVVRREVCAGVAAAGCGGAGLAGSITVLAELCTKEVTACGASARVAGLAVLPIKIRSIRTSQTSGCRTITSSAAGRAGPADFIRILESTCGT